MGSILRMLRNRAGRAAIGMAFLPVSGSAWAGSVVSLPVVEDVTINRSNPLSNLNSITSGGGLLVGLDGTGADYSFYAKFAVPVLPAGQTITSAQLVGTYNTPIGNVSGSSVFARFVADDSWNEFGVTAANAPAPEGNILAGLETSLLTVGEHKFSDLALTSIVNREAHGDGVLSLRFDTVDGRFDDLQNFSSKESGMGGAFRLEVEVSKVKPIPLPPAALSVLAMAPIGAVHLWKRRRRVVSE